MLVQDSIILGDIPLGQLFFLRIENALDLTQQGAVLEIVSDFANLASEISSFCAFKGEKFLEVSPLKNCYAYRILKCSLTHFSPLKMESQTQIFEIAPDNFGLSARGSNPEMASPNYYFALNAKEMIWSENLNKLYEDSKANQWNSAQILWNEIPHYPKDLEFAIAQIMTYLVENEFSALYIPSKFLSQVSPYYYEVPLLLSAIIGDEARHIETFIKRAKATGLGLQYSTRTTQQSLWTLFKENDYLKSSFLLHIMGEGTFIDLLKFLEDYAQDEESKKLLNLARKDEVRHVAYGMQNVKSAILSYPQRIQKLKEAVLNRKHYLDELSGESSLLLESLSIYAGGGSSPAQIKRGFEALEDLKEKMEKNRTKRLVECGIDEELAQELSQAHTPNFM